MNFFVSDEQTMAVLLKEIKKRKMHTHDESPHGDKATKYIITQTLCSKLGKEKKKKRK